MSESDSLARPVIPQELMLSRLEQSEQMREFFIQMWLQNPALARQGGARVLSLVSEGRDRRINSAAKSEGLAGAPQSHA